MKLKLLPCPFCGSRKTNIEEEGGQYWTSGYYVECSACGARTAAWIKQDVAIHRWNERIKKLSEKKKLCSYCGKRPIGDDLRFLCDYCYKNNSEEDEAYNRKNRGNYRGGKE